MLDQKASHLAGGVTRVEKAKVGLIQFCISPPKTDVRIFVYYDSAHNIMASIPEKHGGTGDEGDYMYSCHGRISMTFCIIISPIPPPPKKKHAHRWRTR